MEEHAHLYPMPGGNLSRKRAELAPGIHDAFREFSAQAFAAGALDARTKQLIAVAAAHITQCPYCIRGHTRSALRAGATEEQIIEAVWVAAEMRAGASYAHALIAVQEMESLQRVTGQG